MAEKLLRYVFHGGVYRYDALVMDNWEGKVSAVSEKQAKARIVGQAKRLLGYDYSAGGFRLNGKLSIENA